MSTYAKATWDAASYASFRPTYPRALFETIYRYHQGKDAARSTERWNRALDLGCGTGQVTVVLPNEFKHVDGVDPSNKMIEQARGSLPGAQKNNIQYHVSSAEDLSFIQEESIDIVTAGQAIHWFDYQRLWPEVERVLKRGGTAAFWIYSELRLVNHPSVAPLISAYASDKSQNLGPHWEQPGRNILDNHLQDIQFPSSPGWDVSSQSRVYFAGSHHQDSIVLGPNDKRHDVILQKTLTWAGFEAYFRTWSALYTFQRAHPEDAQREDGDIVTRFVKRIKDQVREDTGAEPGDEVQVEWPIALILAKKTT